MAHSVVPMDDALVLVALDIGGRGIAESCGLAGMKKAAYPSV